MLLQTGSCFHKLDPVCAKMLAIFDHDPVCMKMPLDTLVYSIIMLRLPGYFSLQYYATHTGGADAPQVNIINLVLCVCTFVKQKYKHHDALASDKLGSTQFVMTNWVNTQFA